MTKIERSAVSSNLLKVTFAVERFWKGVKTGRVSIYTAAQTALCGVPFEVNKKYLVIAAAGDDGRLNVGLCPWLEKEQNEAAYRARLGRGKKPKGN